MATSRRTSTPDSTGIVARNGRETLARPSNAASPAADGDIQTAQLVDTDELSVQSARDRDEPGHWRNSGLCNVLPDAHGKLVRVRIATMRTILGVRNDASWETGR